MRKILLGLVAAAAIATPLAAAAAANADTASSDPTCVPVKAAIAVTHIEYKYIPKVRGQGPTHWNKWRSDPRQVGTIDYSATATRPASSPTCRRWRP